MDWQIAIGGRFQVKGSQVERVLRQRPTEKGKRSLAAIKHRTEECIDMLHGIRPTLDLQEEARSSVFDVVILALVGGVSAIALGAIFARYSVARRNITRRGEL